MYGNSFESFLVAVVNPNQPSLERWARENGVDGDFAAICENAKAKEYILGELTTTAKANKVLANYFNSSDSHLYLKKFFFLLLTASSFEFFSQS